MIVIRINMRIVIASGKGGTGKTAVATNLAASIDNISLFDCDVEEPNAHLFFPFKLEKVDDVCLKVPVIDEKQCNLCGKCSDFCEYNALATLPSQVLFFPELCHGCGGCMLVCPEDAIHEGERNVGMIERARLNGISFYRGVLNVGEAMATPVIKALKKKITDDNDTILDSPPGNACPMIETVHDVDYCILVTEPTPFGLYDLKLAVDVVKKLEVPFGVIINKDGIGDKGVEHYCLQEDILILMRIPYSREIASLYSQGKLFAWEMQGWKEKFQHLFKTLEGQI
jgi:MinD superfamily P-loop ATPase